MSKNEDFKQIAKLMAEAQKYCEISFDFHDQAAQIYRKYELKPTEELLKVIPEFKNHEDLTAEVDKWHEKYPDAGASWEEFEAIMLDKKLELYIVGGEVLIGYCRTGNKTISLGHIPIIDPNPDYYN